MRTINTKKKRNDTHTKKNKTKGKKNRLMNLSEILAECFMDVYRTSGVYYANNRIESQRGYQCIV